MFVLQRLAEWRLDACPVIGSIIGGAEAEEEEDALRSQPFAYDSALSAYYWFGQEDCRIYRHYPDNTPAQRHNAYLKAREAQHAAFALRARPGF